MNQDQDATRSTRAEAHAAKLVRMTKRQAAPASATTAAILGRNPKEEPLPFSEKLIIQGSWHGQRKKRRSSYEVPGQTAAELGLGLSAPP